MKKDTVRINVVWISIFAFILLIGTASSDITPYDDMDFRCSYDLLNVSDLSVCSNLTINGCLLFNGTQYCNYVTVDKCCGDYDTVQGAIDSITDATADKKYLVYIYPGIYEDYVNLAGAGVRGEVTISGSTGTLYTFPDAGGNIRNIKFSGTPTTTGMIILNISSGQHRAWDVSLVMVSSTTGIEGTLVEQTGGEFLIHRAHMTYTLSGDAQAAVLHSIFNITGTSILHVIDNDIDVVVGDEDDTVVLLDELTTATVETHVNNNIIHMNLSNTNYVGVCGMYYAHGAGTDKNILSNHLHMYTTSGLGIAYSVYMDTTGNNGEIHTTANRIMVEGFGSNYAANIAIGDTLVGHFDDVIASDGFTGAGTLETVSSFQDGQFTFSDESIGLDDAEIRLGAATITDATVEDTALDWSTAQALAHTLVWGFGNTAMSMIFTIFDNRDTDYTRVAQDDPTLFIHSHNDPTTNDTKAEWGSLHMRNMTGEDEDCCGFDFFIDAGTSNITLNDDVRVAGNHTLGDCAGTIVIDIYDNGTYAYFTTTHPLLLSNVLRLEHTDAPAACVADLEGAIYYDASMTELCMCDGTNYIQVDGGGACT